MTRPASEIIEEYLSRLQTALEAATATDADDVVAEIRSLLVEAAGDDPEAAVAEIERLGTPEDLARGILVERGLDDSAGMSTGVWWRLGIAAPIDIAIGLAVPLGAALPLLIVAGTGEPRGVSITVAALLGLATLAWPFFIWRPWRRGGRSLSPGMTLTGVAVVRAPGFWRVVRIGEMGALGLAPRRHVGRAVAIALVAAVLLAGSLLVGLDAAGTWVVSSAMTAGVIGGGPVGSALSAREARTMVTRLYGALGGAAGEESAAASAASAEAATQLKALASHVATLRISSASVNSVTRIAPGVYRLQVDESSEREPHSDPAGVSTITVARRSWMNADGSVRTDWVIVAIEPGVGVGGK